ncbi:MAG: hypothetical protein HY548_07175 [Elusimicrobia bacterium]|nr:hypothetical protein [Elusimicrobiota bacterium]
MSRRNGRNKADGYASTMELPAMPEKTSAEKAGQEYLHLKARIALLKEQLDQQEQEVMLAMKGENRVVMVCKLDGDRFKFEISEQSEKLTLRRA